jgi:hypothetical protein
LISEAYYTEGMKKRHDPLNILLLVSGIIFLGVAGYVAHESLKPDSTVNPISESPGKLPPFQGQ